MCDHCLTHGYPPPAAWTMRAELDDIDRLLKVLELRSVATTCGMISTEESAVCRELAQVLRGLLTFAQTLAQRWQATYRSSQDGL